jgi:hypothetical protein
MSGHASCFKNNEAVSATGKINAPNIHQSTNDRPRLLAIKAGISPARIRSISRKGSPESDIFVSYVM